MSAGEFRRCPFTGHMAIVAPERADRPAATIVFPEPSDDPAACPFCPGREDQTPPESYAARHSGRAGEPSNWITRAFPNRYPAVVANTPAEGRHEVIVACREHAATLGRLGNLGMMHLLAAWRERMQSMMAEAQWRTRTIFHNQGMAAGASQRHPHSQALALPFVGPDDPQQWGAFTAADPIGRAMAAERRDGRRVASDSSWGMAWCPYASRFAGEVWFAPAHAERFEDLHRIQCGSELMPLLAAVEADSPALNLILHAPPPGHGGRWLIRIIPRTAGIAGLELGTGIYVNPLPPEIAAARLRARMRLA